MEFFKPILPSGIYQIWFRGNKLCDSGDDLKGFLEGFLDEGIWVGRRGRRRKKGGRESVDEKGEGDETVFFVCGDEKREKGKLPNKGACWKDSKVRSRRVCRLRDMF